MSANSSPVGSVNDSPTSSAGSSPVSSVNDSPSGRSRLKPVDLERIYFQSMYPTALKTAHVSPLQCILNKSIAREMQESGIRLAKIKFDYQDRTKTAYFVLGPKDQN